MVWTQPAALEKGRSVHEGGALLSKHIVCGKWPRTRQQTNLLTGRMSRAPCMCVRQRAKILNVCVGD